MYERKGATGMAGLVKKPPNLNRTNFINISSNKEIHTSKADIVLETRPIIKIFWEKLNH